jgi:hypothetical protein
MPSFRLISVTEPGLFQPTLATVRKIAPDLMWGMYSFHLAPNNTVNHLHMHAWCPKLSTKSLDHQLAETPGKNAPLYLVLKALKEVEAERKRLNVPRKPYAKSNRLQEEIPEYIKSAIQPKPKGTSQIWCFAINNVIKIYRNIIVKKHNYLNALRTLRVKDFTRRQKYQSCT